MLWKKITLTRFDERTWDGNVDRNELSQRPFESFQPLQKYAPIRAIRLSPNC